MKKLRTFYTKINNVNLYKHFTENIKASTKASSNEDSKNEQFKEDTQNAEKNKEQKKPFINGNFLGKFTSLFKHTFNLGDSIEATMSKRKAEAAIKKASVIELTEEQADEVI
jgi:hypothetical protein